MNYSITLINRETGCRITQRFNKSTSDAAALKEFLTNLENFSGPVTLTDWDIIDIHDIGEEVIYHEA